MPGHECAECACQQGGESDALSGQQHYLSDPDTAMI